MNTLSTDPAPNAFLGSTVKNTLLSSAGNIILIVVSLLSTDSSLMLGAKYQ